MEEVRETIGIDKIDMSSKLIFIEEYHNADANFILHAITSHCIDKKHIVCFVLFHNTFSHFHNIGMKLGYNLMNLRGSNIIVIEPLNIIFKNIQNEKNTDYYKIPEFNVKNKSTTLVNQIFELIKNEYRTIKKETDSGTSYIIIDDISHLFDIGLNIEDVWLFIRNVRSFIYTEPLLTICIASHIYKRVEELCESNVICYGLRYLADLVISIQSLETGYSENVSGKMVICWKSQNERLKLKYPEEILYLFKLFDRKVKLFASGSLHAI
jgi:hypothetical protein